MRQANNEKAFTITELLVITAIISLMSTLILANYRAGELQFALESSSHKLAQDLRRSQEMAMSMRQFSCPSGTLKGYGIRFIKDGESYSLRARCDTGAAFQDSSLEDIPLERGIKIKELKKSANAPPVGFLDVFFYPPDPETDLEGVARVTITLSLKSDLTNAKIISVNTSGLITLE